MEKQEEYTITIAEIEGTGFIPGVPGQFGNCRVKLVNGEVVEVVPLGQPFSDERKPAVENFAAGLTYVETPEDVKHLAGSSVVPHKSKSEKSK